MAYRRCLLSSYSIYSRPCFCKATPQLPMTQSQYLMLSAVRSEMYSATFCPRFCLLTLPCPHKTRGTRLRKMQIHKNNLFIPSPHSPFKHTHYAHFICIEQCYSSISPTLPLNSPYLSLVVSVAIRGEALRPTVLVLRTCKEKKGSYRTFPLSQCPLRVYKGCS